MLAILAAALVALDETQSTSSSRNATDAGSRVAGRLVAIYAAGLEGVTIVLARADDPTNPLTTTAGSDGRFTFERVPAGRYHVSAVKPGYTSQTLTDGANRFTPGVSVIVRSGTNVANVEIPLRRAATVSGRVIRSDGAAAPGIHVVLARRIGQTLVTLDHTQTTTAWDGRYAIEGLPPGTYRVLAAGVGAPPGNGTLQSASPEQAAFEINRTRANEFTRTLFPGVPVTEPGETITLIEGVNADGIDIWLVPSRRFSISGRVSWPHDVTIGDVTIEYAGPADRHANVWTVSDPGGLFTIDAVSPGTIVLLASADSSRGPLMGLISTEVSVESVEDLTIALGPPGVVEGRVTFPSDLPASARPASIALVQKLFNVSPLYEAPEAPLSADGTFRLTRALGEYEFTFPGLPAGTRISVSRSGQNLTRNRIGIGTGEIVTGIVVTVGQ